MFSRNELLVFLITMLVVIVGLPTFSLIVDRKVCFAKAEALDYKADWGYFKGCVLTDKNGKTLLLEQLRELGR